MQRTENIFYNDKDAGLVCIVQTDVTHVFQNEQKKREAREEALALANQANQAKTRFLSSMSHDIRTPLNAVITMAELAAMDFTDTKQIKESVSIILSSSKHLLNLVNDVLDLSKLENGSMVLTNEPYSVETELSSILKMVKPIFEQKHQLLTVRRDITYDNILGDNLRFRKVLLNLLGNAGKFTKEGGEIVLEISVKPNVNGKTAKMRFMVEDNGVGIKKEQMEHIFEPFYREGASYINHIEGTGLGLSIVEQIVKSRGGSIHVESEEGKGSRFIVNTTLPLAARVDKAEMETDEEIGTDEIDFTGIHALLVEDHPINALVASQLFEKYNAEITLAENGEIGYTKMKESKPGTYDIIFMDVQMPVMNGYEATKAIRKLKHPQAADIPIIALTANAFAEDIEKCRMAGMSGHMAKPIRVSELCKVMEKVLSGKKTKNL